MFGRAKTGPLILFDFDGVIADSGEIYLETFLGVCRELGLNQFQSKEDFLALFEGNVILTLMKKGFPLRRLKRLLEDFRPRIDAANLSIPPFEGMLQTLNQLAERHPVYVITSNTTENVEGFLERHGVRGVLGVVGADQTVSKVRRIRRARRRHRDRIPYYIGDTKGDIYEARRARAVPMGVAWGWHGAEKLAEAQPEHVFASPEALREFFLS